MRRTTPRGMLAAAAVLVALVSGVLHAGAAEARAWLGVYTQEVTDEIRDGLDLRGADGVLVARIVPGSPADRAGLRKGDVIVTFASRGVTSPDRLSELVGDAQSGESVSIIVMRDGERRTLSARLDSRPEDGTPAPSMNDGEDDDSDEAPAPPPAPRAPRAPRAPGEAGQRRLEIRVPEHGGPSAPGNPHVRTFRWNGEGEMPQEMRELVGDLNLDELHGLEGHEGIPGIEGLGRLQGIGPGGKHVVMQMAGRGRLGVRVQELDADMASALGASGAKGVVVLEVLGDTPAEKAGLKAGDILTSVDGTAVYDANDLVKALADKEGAVSLSVTRRGARQTVRATLQDTRRATRMRSGSDQMGLGRTGDRRVIRLRDNEGTDREGLRQELDELREQVRELRQRLEESRR